MPTDGFDDLIDDLNELEQNAEELDGENQVPLTELLNPGFMQKYTEFASIDEMFEQSKWTVESEEDLDAIPDQEFDTYVRDHTQFTDSEEMMGMAAEEWTAEQMGF